MRLNWFFEFHTFLFAKKKMSSLLLNLNLTSHAMAPKNCIFELYHPMVIEEFDYIDYIYFLISKYSFLFDIIIIILLSSLICYQIFYLDYERINEIENLKRKNKLLEDELEESKESINKIIKLLNKDSNQSHEQLTPCSCEACKNFFNEIIYLKRINAPFDQL